MEFTRRLNALLMNLWGRKCSPRPTPPPSLLLSELFVKLHCFHSSVCPLEKYQPAGSTEGREEQGEQRNVERNLAN